MPRKSPTAPGPVQSVSPAPGPDGQPPWRSSSVISLFQAATDGIVMTGTEGTIMFINQAAEQIFGYTAAELFGQFLSLLIPEHEACPGHHSQLEFPIKSKDGQEFPVEISCSRIPEHDRFFSLCIVRDIRERRRIEEENMKLAAIVDSSNDSIIGLDMQGRIVSWNSAAQKIYGYTREEALGQPISMLFPPERPDEVLELLVRIRQGERVEHLEKERVRKDGQRIFISLTISPVRDIYGRIIGTSTISRDITERKQLEEKIAKDRQFLATLLNTIDTLVLVLDPRGRVVNTNQACESLLGYPALETGGRAFWDIFIPKKEIPAMRKRFRSLLREQGALQFESDWLTRDGQLKRIAWSNATLPDEKGRTRYLILTGIDVTERVRWEQQVLSSLKEKEVMLQEIHHRVKNNLQLISSLFSLQAKFVRNDQLSRILRESQSRIKSIALLHEQLYQSQDLVNLDFHSYIKGLLRQLFRTYDADASHISLYLDLEPAALDIDTAIPCGLLLNELVSNALKYAFPEGQPGEVAVAFKMNQNQYVLTVSDNGVGLPADLELAHSPTLGLRLVATLTQQLQGNLEIEKGPPASFTLTFSPGARKS